FGARPFTQPMPRVDVLPRNAVSSLTPYPQAYANETLMPVDRLLGGGYGPIEGRPPGSVWAHQRWNEFPPCACVETTQSPATTNRMASTPDGGGGLINVPGDWHETMSTHWFHDHMFGFTSQNVYKGNVAMLNIYSGLDRGNEEIDDGVNLRLPSGSAKDWGNLDYDVNLVLADKAMDRDGQQYFDIFNSEGFLGDVMTTNFAYNPYFEVERRKYRF